MVSQKNHKFLRNEALILESLANKNIVKFKQVRE